MSSLHLLAEARMRADLSAGHGVDPSQYGRALELDDLRGVPEELRSAYLLLRGAGFVPEEVALRQEVRRIEDLLRPLSADDPERGALERRLRDTELRFELLLERARIARGGGAYHAALRRRLARGR